MESQHFAHDTADTPSVENFSAGSTEGNRGQAGTTKRSAKTIS